jgi:hypothetical protein
MPAVAFGDSRVGKNPSGTVQGDPGKEFELGKASFFSWEGLEATSRETALRAPSVGESLVLRVGILVLQDVWCCHGEDSPAV